MKLSKMTGTLLLSLGIIAFVPSMASAHCDTVDGPVITDAKHALEANNVNYILKWVFPEDEKELTEVFEQTMKVRDQSPEAQELADQYLFENLVRIHRAGEGAPYTGVKPEGTPMEEAIIAADHSIEVGDLSAFEGGLIEEERMPELEEKFEQVLATKDFEENDVEAGRKFVESYVQYTHFAEGEEHGEGHAVEGDAHHDEHAAESDSHNAEHGATESEQADVDVAAEAAHAGELQEESVSSSWIPWSLAGLFFITTLLSHFRKHKHE